MRRVSVVKVDMQATSAHKGAISMLYVALLAALFLFIIFLLATQIWGPAWDIRNIWKVKI